MVNIVADTETTKLNTCLSKLSKGDMEVLSYLYNNLARPVYLLALSILRDKYLAEDVLQDTFIKICEKADLYKEGNPKAWAMMIARNLSLNRLKKRSLEYMTDKPLTKAKNDAIDSSLILTDAFNVLSEEEAQIVSLYIYAGLKHKEIAKIVSLSYSNVRKKYRAALSKLEDYFREV